jgi:hypothetical protein
MRESSLISITACCFLLAGPPPLSGFQRFAQALYLALLVLAFRRSYTAYSTYPRQAAPSSNMAVDIIKTDNSHISSCDYLHLEEVE